MTTLFKFLIIINIIAGTICLFAHSYMGVLLNFGLALWNTCIVEALGESDE